MSTKNVKISITVITCVLVLVFGLTAFFLFFDNEKQNNSVDAATVTETYKFSPTFVEFNVTYDNTYGSIMSMDGALHPFNDWYSLTDFQNNI